MKPRTNSHTLRRELELSERRRLNLKRQTVLDALDPEDNSLWDHAGFNHPSSGLFYCPVQ